MVPREFTAGDTVTFTETLNPSVSLNYPLDSYSCVFVLRGEGQLDVIGEFQPPRTWQFVISAGQSQSIPAGNYAFRIYLEGNGERHPVIEGNIRVKPNLSMQGSGYDNRSQTQKWLDQVNEAIQNLIEGGAIQTLEIMGRSLRRYDLDQLLQLKKVLEAQLSAELRAQGKRNPYRYIVAGRVDGHIR